MMYVASVMVVNFSLILKICEKSTPSEASSHFHEPNQNTNIFLSVYNMALLILILQLLLLINFLIIYCLNSY